MAGVDEMNCDELVEKVTDYLEQALSSPDLARWDDHVQVCIGCQGHRGEVRVALRVLRGLAGLAGRASLRTWICRILVRIAQRRAGIESRSTPFSTLDDDHGGDFVAVAPDSFVKEGPRTGRWVTVPDDWSRVPEDKLLSYELRDMVKAEIAKLPPAQREVITLRDIEGWSTAEVSELLGIQDGHQRVLLHRARSRVRLALERYLEPPVAA